MVYYVFLDPSLISIAAAHGEAGLSCLASLLRALAENCCIAEFDDWRISPALRQQLANNVADGTEWSKRIKVLLAHLVKQNRFIITLKAPEPHPPISDVAAAAQQAETAELDAILTAETVAPSGGATPVIGLFEFARSHFDSSRGRHAVQGVILGGGEHSTVEFYAKFLRKLLRHARSVDFLDRFFGEKYRDNFKFSMRAIVRQFATSRDACATQTITIHTGNDARGHVVNCRTDVATFHPDITVTVEAYDSPALPHERYLLTNQFALEIGRGLDLFDEGSNRNRDVSLSFKDPKDVRTLLHRAAGSRIHPTS